VKASVFVGTSLDGFIARSDGALDFLPEGGGEPHGYDEFMATVDALAIGRKTYETVLAFDAWPYGDKSVFVLSSRPLAAAPPGARVERLSGSPAEVHAQPVLIGEGISLFGAVGREIPLKHITTRQYASGLVQSEYEVGT
jgi:hypothetical protein